MSTDDSKTPDTEETAAIDTGPWARPVAGVDQTALYAKGMPPWQFATFEAFARGLDRPAGVIEIVDETPGWLSAAERVRLHSLARATRKVGLCLPDPGPRTCAAVEDGWSAR